MQVEFFFDCSSPWTYLAFRQIQPVVERYAATLGFRPILVGGVFNAINPSVYENRANPVVPKMRYYQKDLRDWADFVGIEIGSPEVFPVNSVKAMRGCFLAEEAGCLPDFAEAVFAAYWTDLRDISQDEVLAPIVEAVGMDRDAFFAGIASDAIKAKLRENTEELIERGGFGSPTFFLDGEDMFFGNDRIPLLERKLQQTRVMD